MYDPITGKYGLAIMRALRAAGVATVGAMGLGIFLMVRRERRSGQFDNRDVGGVYDADGGVSSVSQIGVGDAYQRHTSAKV
jgi:hypothetical protein